MKEWYAIQHGNNFESDYGSYDYDEAVAWANEEIERWPGEEIRIAVCVNDTDYVDREIIIKEGTR